MKVKHLQHALDSEGPHSGPGFQPHTLLLLGAGPAHVHVLSRLAREPLVGVQVVLVAPYPRLMDAGMVPGLVAGHCSADACAIPLAELVRRAGVRWLQAGVTTFDASRRRVQLDNGTELSFDWASLDTCLVQDRDAIEAAMPGARTHALFLHPVEGFVALWPRVLAMGSERALRVAVIGADMAGIELALALAQRLPHCAITVLSGDTARGAEHPGTLQARIARTLKRRKITVLQERATGFHDGNVQLASGARLACDVPLITVGAQAPRWLRQSELALDAEGFVQRNAYLQSSSHPQVFAPGELGHRGASAMRTGPALVRNLAATVRNTALQAHQPPAHPLHLLACGDKTAIASWGRWSAQGRWVWWWKNAMERRFIARYTVSTPGGA